MNVFFLLHVSKKTMMNNLKFILKKRLIKYCTNGSGFDSLEYLSLIFNLNFYKNIDELLNWLK